MTIPQRILVKFFVTEGQDLDPTEVIPTFHRWIQEKTVSGLLIDVADYKHVPDGPGIILIGHDVDYGLDYSDGRMGLLLTRKVSRIADVGDLQGHVGAAIEAAQQAAVALEESKLGLRFDKARFEIRLVDRLLAGNSAEIYQTHLPALTAAVQNAFGTGTQLARANNNPRKPLTIDVQITPELA